MVLWQVDVIKRVPYSPNPSGYYYWSSVWYVDPADYSGITPLLSRVRAVDSFVTMANVTYMKYIVKSPPGRSNVIATIPDGFNHGGQPLDPNGGSMINVARILTVAADGTWSYRYAGRPMPAGWCDGQKINSTGLMWIGGQIGAMRVTSGHPPMRHQSGSPIVGGTVPDLLSQWQLRHGTKRRERVY